MRRLASMAAGAQMSNTEFVSLDSSSFPPTQRVQLLNLRAAYMNGPQIRIHIA